jgi:hypothetical protein
MIECETLESLRHFWTEHISADVPCDQQLEIGCDKQDQTLSLFASLLAWLANAIESVLELPDNFYGLYRAP